MHSQPEAQWAFLLKSRKGRVFMQGVWSGCSSTRGRVNGHHGRSLQEDALLPVPLTVPPTPPCAVPVQISPLHNTKFNRQSVLNTSVPTLAYGC